jgi:hypothetical protein
MVTHHLDLIQWPWSTQGDPELRLNVSLSEIPKSLSSETSMGATEEVWAEIAGKHIAAEDSICPAAEDSICPEPGKQGISDDRHKVTYISEMANSQGTSESFRHLSYQIPGLTNTTWEVPLVEQDGPTAKESWDSVVPLAYECFAPTPNASQIVAANEVTAEDYNHLAAAANRSRPEAASDSQTAIVYGLEDQVFLVPNFTSEADYEQQRAKDIKVWQGGAQTEWAVEAANVVLLGGMPQSAARITTPVHVPLDDMSGLVAHNDKSVVFAPLEVRGFGKALASSISPTQSLPSLLINAFYHPFSSSTLPAPLHSPLSTLHKLEPVLPAGYLLDLLHSSFPPPVPSPLQCLLFPVVSFAHVMILSSVPVIHSPTPPPSLHSSSTPHPRLKHSTPLHHWAILHTPFLSFPIPSIPLSTPTYHPSPNLQLTYPQPPFSSSLLLFPSSFFPRPQASSALHQLE